MQLQVNLGGNPVTGTEQSKDKKPWEGICCKACYYAKYDRCTCKCGGKFHGVGSGNLLKTHSGSRELQVQTAFKSDPKAQIYERLIKDWQCVECKGSLQGEPILHYDHQCGFPVEGFQEKQWLFITCPVCGYQNSLLKLGVPSTADYVAAQNAQPIAPKFVEEDEE